MIIKLCGMTEQENYDALLSKGIDWIGFNFFPESKRFIGNRNILEAKGKNHKRVGVFVNQESEFILEMAGKHRLDIIQLHGNESPVFCQKIQEYFPVIKVFRLEKDFDFTHCKSFASCRYFLFDTYSPKWGGSGKKFDWTLLSRYKGERPFLLAGGIGPEDADTIKKVRHKFLAGVDINSGFETAPGVKNIEAVHSFVKILKS